MARRWNPGFGIALDTRGWRQTVKRAGGFPNMQRGQERLFGLGIAALVAQYSAQVDVDLEVSGGARDGVAELLGGLWYLPRW